MAQTTPVDPPTIEEGGSRPTYARKRQQSMIDVARGKKKPPGRIRGWPDKHKQEDLDARPYRVVQINQEQQFSYCSNFVKTSKYSILSFLPMFLAEEFHYKKKIANLYFLVVAAAQCIPQITNTRGMPTVMIPLTFVVLCDAIFAIIEDRQRHKADAEANARRTQVYNFKTQSFEETQWNALQVGDVVKVENREQIPADLCILGCAEPDPEYPAGICYVETKSLDGETNLKIRQCVVDVVGVVSEESDVALLQGEIEMEHPNKLIESFTGVLELGNTAALEAAATPATPARRAASRGSEHEAAGTGTGGGGGAGEKGEGEGEGGEGGPGASASRRSEGAASAQGGGEGPWKSSLQPKNLLLRGCVLRNTQWVVGAVLNTGHDTKIIMSITEAPKKSSSLELRINTEIKRIVVFLLLICLWGAVGSVSWNAAWVYDDGSEYLNWELTVWTNLEYFVVQFFYFLLLLCNFIPVSLYVSMNTVKFFQALFINMDIEMYHPDTDTPALVRTFTLNEELGQITHVFSDKTGTLTENVMDFRKCSVGGVAYGRGITEIGRAALAQRGEEVSKEDEAAEALARALRVPHVAFHDDTLYRDLEEREGHVPGQSAKLRKFFRLLSVCHTVIPERTEGGGVALSASSPDDEALVCAAKYFGYDFRDRQDGAAVVAVKETGRAERYEVLEVVDFTSARKRMSVVVRDPEGQLLVLSKGADTVMEVRLAAGQEAQWRAAARDMVRFATEGLRTLVVGQRALSQREYEDWQDRYTAAATDLEQIELQKNGKPNLIDDLTEEIEADLELLGVTAIEDKLQDGVGQTISDLSKAGIAIWVLTGDKEETAINIAVACQLILPSEEHMRRIVINLDHYPSAKEIRAALVEERRRLEKEQDKAASSAAAPPPLPRCLVIDGPSLIPAMSDEVRPELLALGRLCRAVVACRVSPDQKREMVALVKDNVPGVRALAIGDGANDVAMIQEAHVGVGISGQEGLQAVNSSDYAVAQFKYLRKLLLVHGRWNYRRMSKLVCYVFYKNILMSLPMFWFAFAAGFGGQKFYVEVGIQFYNLFYTSLPIILIGIYDRDISADLALRFPSLYFVGIKDTYFTVKIFWVWMASAIWEAATVCVLPLFLSGNSFDSFWESGATTFTAVVIMVNLKLIFHQFAWYWIHLFIVLLSCALWFMLGWISNRLVVVDYDAYYTFDKDLKSHTYWLLVMLLCMIGIMRDLYWKGYNRWFHPSPHHIVEEIDAYDLPVPKELSLARRDRPDDLASAASGASQARGPGAAAGAPPAHSHDAPPPPPPPPPRARSRTGSVDDQLLPFDRDGQKAARPVRGHRAVITAKMARVDLGGFAFSSDDTSQAAQGALVRGGIRRRNQRQERERFRKARAAEPSKSMVSTTSRGSEVQSQNSGLEAGLEAMGELFRSINLPGPLSLPRSTGSRGEGRPRPFRRNTQSAIEVHRVLNSTLPGQLAAGRPPLAGSRAGSPRTSRQPSDVALRGGGGGGGGHEARGGGRPPPPSPRRRDLGRPKPSMEGAYGDVGGRAAHGGAHTPGGGSAVDFFDVVGATIDEDGGGDGESKAEL